MLLRRFHDQALAQVSYLLACTRTGDALVVDPNRDVEQYLRAAAALGMRIAHVTETHIHADFVSGAKELAERSGATLYLSDAGEAPWKYRYAQPTRAELVRDGDSFSIGDVRIDVLHTPGHTPEHITFLVTDTAGADQPMGAFTGDFIFVGDVGRPDLLERAANEQGTMRRAARDLFDSLQRFKEQPDFLQLWPGHGAGSACGKSLGAMPQSTLGYERRFNWALTASDREEFVESVLAGQPDPPRYFAVMKRVNREGPEPLGGIRPPERLPPTRLAAVVDARSIIVDARGAEVFAAGHVPGAINIPLTSSFLTWAGWLLPYDRDIFLIVADESDAESAVRQLRLLGLDRVRGIFSGDAVAMWAEHGRSLQTVPQMAAGEAAVRLADRLSRATVVDVRTAAEWEGGHVPGAVHIPLGHLRERLAELPTGAPVVAYCQSGARSAIATSVLQAEGFESVYEMRGGFAEWSRSGLPTEGEPAAAARVQRGLLSTGGR